MIKANELRIGNWLQFDNMIQPSRRIKVNARFFSSLASGRVEQELKDDEPINEYYQPIPLTPEILEKAGFERGCPYSKEKGFTAPNEAFFFENDYYPKEMSSGRDISIEIKYLHQLQNLYWSLCGEELTVNFKDLTYQ